MTKPVRITLLVLLVLAVSAGVWLVFLQPSEDVEPPETEPVVETQPEEAADHVIEDIVPDVSPTQGTNPFSETYKNPFQ